MPGFQTEFRAAMPSRVVAVVTCVIAVSFAAAAFIWGMPVWQRILFSALSLASLVGIAEVWMTRVRLTANAVQISAKFRQSVVPRPQIASVNWEKGGGTALKLVDGKWHRLPGVGRSPQALTNSIRAWLKHTNLSPSSNNSSERLR
jgi:hypothetical protein